MKNAKMLKKVSAIVLLMAMMMTVFSGCGKEEKTAGVTEVEWFINDQTWPDKDELWRTTPTLQEIVKKTGVIPNVSIPTGMGSEKINLMMATGDMPDLLTFQATDPQLDQLVEKKVVYTMDELLEKYDKENKVEIPDSVRVFGAQQLDGVLYGFPSYLPPDWQIDHGSLNTRAFMVRTDIYEELGCPDMTTPEGFYNALVAFKEKYPEINGKKTIPLCLWSGLNGISRLKCSFGIQDFYVDEQGNYVSPWRNPQYEEFIKYMTKLNQAGLIDKEAYVKKPDQITEDLSNGLSFVVLWNFDAMTEINRALGQIANGARYKVIEPMNATDKPVTLTSYVRKPWLVTVIPREAKNPEAAFKLASYMFSKECVLRRHYGVEGEDWVRIDENTIQQTDSYAERSKEEGFRQKTGITAFRVIHHTWDEVLPAPSVEQPPEEKEDRPLANKYVDKSNMWRSLMKNANPESEEGIIETRSIPMIEKATPGIYMAATAEEGIAAWKKLLSDLDSIGYDKVEKFNTEQMKVAKERYSALEK